jgi:hypothetical protein
LKLNFYPKNNIFQIVLGLLLATVVGVSAQTVTSKSVPTPLKTVGVPSSIDRQFKRDAARLALRLDSEKEDVRYLPTSINRDFQTSIYKALCNIYLNNEVGKSVARCNIHTFPNPSIDHIVVVYNRNMDWASLLRQGISEVTHKEFNRLLDQYDIAIEKHVQWNDANDALTLRSKEPLNMASLAAQLSEIPGVIQIDLGLPKLAGNDIKARRIIGGWEVDFILALGSGKKHIWKFRALDNAQITVLGETGDPLPTWMRCDKEGLPTAFANN